MRFSFVSIISALAVTALALPDPSKEPKKHISKNAKQPEELKKFKYGEPVVVSLADGKPVPSETAAAIKKRDGNWLNCRAYQVGWHIQNFHYYIDTWGNWDDDWGTRYLAQLRGHCRPANIESWTFWYDGNWYLNGGHADFFLPSYNVQCVLDAAWEASNPFGAIWGATCEVYYVV
ncbi:hypothetical protein TWF788_009815 [Orbilia oligospora]|uniref:Uncharacterized protein n=1 Tax=Orbilia oligospora TaxID=2813651 RepID=A0A6G1M5D5_ORBOL|nr:hypothetical protein TWF788_009815 [Orbilia oligospora]KAF3209759.1 hypothetical protein TWF679_007298 [Orbilia oligospora]KAF3227757.1 hypothetical protein TWF191_003277 [Orbilia oligospora]KAF3244422.1 hypothetical protein TWF192_007714 [Orbilia oligospora]